MYILPPLTLSSTTTIIFPLLTTSLEVAWSTSLVTTLDNGDVSTSTGYDRITETTTLTIPPITTDRIDLWNVNISSGVSSSLIYITSSISPPPFTITDDRNPWSQQGVTHPPQTRTITPPPYPYSTTSPGPQQNPPIAHRSGSPRNPCKIGCGHKCLGLFCHLPCLLDCISGPGLGFYDPDDPDPEGPPTPEPEPSQPSPSPTSCSESTVTDFWVSCTSISSDSSSCTTTSSSLVTGCDVTASATTTGAESCATADAIEDQGEDGGAQNTASATITPPPNTSTPAPTATISCSLQDEDPDLGINSAYCVCDGSLNYPEPSSTGSCVFTALPSQTINPTASPSVVTSNCQVCTIVDVNNGECTTLPNCVPTASSTPAAPSAQPTPPPAPAQIFNIGYFDECEPDGGIEEGGGASCASYWTIFTDPQGVTYDPCKDKAIFEDTKAFDGNDVVYPVSEGPFAGGGLASCVFTQSKSTSVGSMVCSGTPGTCVKDTSGVKSCDGGDDTWMPVWICTFT